MPNPNVNRLEKENESLKSEIAALKKNLKTFRIRSNLASTMLILQQLWSHLNVLSKRVEEIGKSIELIQRYSYEYSVKIVGLPEIKASESASDTTTLCLSLFQAAGVEISIQDIDIAHRTLTRNATPGPRPVVCKFTRRIGEEK
ncbi:unnamed protein product, partial [Pocillopora meandrina]